MWNEISSHPILWLLGSIGLAFVARNLLKRLIPDLPEKAKFPAKVTDIFVTYISRFFPGWLLNIVGVCLLLFASWFRFSDRFWDIVKIIDDDIFPSLAPDKEFIYLLLLAAVLVTSAVVLICGMVYYNWRLHQEVAALKAAKDDLVSSVEDATRHVLNGFHQIFDRALMLINEASEELWMIDFALKFGLPHTLNDDIRGRYDTLALTKNYGQFYKKGSRDFNSDVGAFYTKLREKLHGTEIPNAYILTLYDDSIMKRFLAPLYGRPIFSKVFKDDQDYKQRVGFVYAELKNAKVDIVRWDLMNRDKRAWPSETKKLDGRFYETDSLPIQLLITRKESDGKFGCLVFMVGTEVLEGVAVKGAEKELGSDQPIEPFIEQGFYTESREIVNVYKMVAAALLTQAKQRYNAGKLKPPYEKKYKRNRDGTFEEVTIQ
jgi:hypothetical protein